MSKVREFDHFKVLMKPDGSPEELGRGAMGVTYKAFDRNLLSISVVKALHIAQASVPSVRRQFLEEAQSMARLRHPSIPQVYYLGQSESQPFYAMEYCEGPSMQQHVRHSGRLPPQQVFVLARQLASALSAVEGAGLVHRDIKPSNLVLTEESNGTARIKLIDFGLAIKDQRENGAIESAFVGTPMFASPEQFEARPILDIRSDIYSLGITLWFMLTNEMPFKGNLMAIMTAQTHDMPSFERLPPMSDALKAVLWKMLQKNKAERHASAADLESEIRSALGADDVDLKLGLIHRTNTLPIQGSVLPDSPYKLIRPEAEGEEPYGRRFIARALHNDQDVALVLLHPPWGGEPKVLDALRDTRVKMHAAPHPHLLPIVGESRIQGHCAYAFERLSVHAQPLLHWCKQKGSLTFLETAALLAQIADAYDAACQRELFWMPDSITRIMVEESRQGEPFIRIEPFDPQAALNRAPLDPAACMDIFRGIALRIIAFAADAGAARCVQAIVAANPPNWPTENLRTIVVNLLQQENVAVPDIVTATPDWTGDLTMDAATATRSDLAENTLSNLSTYHRAITVNVPETNSATTTVSDPLDRRELIERLEQQRRSLLQNEPAAPATHLVSSSLATWSRENSRQLDEQRLLKAMSRELEIKKQEHVELESDLLNLAQKNFLRQESHRQDQDPNQHQTSQTELRLVMRLLRVRFQDRQWKIHRLEWQLADELLDEVERRRVQREENTSSDRLGEIEAHLHDRAQRLARLLRAGLGELDISSQNSIHPTLSSTATMGRSGLIKVAYGRERREFQRLPAIASAPPQLLQLESRMEEIFQEHVRRHLRLAQRQRKLLRAERHIANHPQATTKPNWQSFIESRLPMLRQQIDDLDDELARRASEVFKFKHRENLRREEKELEAAAQRESRRREAEALDAKIEELKALQVRDLAQRKRRRLTWLGVIAAAVLLSLFVARQVKVVERYILEGSVKGEKAWNSLASERQLSRSGGDWSQLLHQVANAYLQATNDADFKTFAARHLVDLQSDGDAALAGLEAQTKAHTPETLNLGLLEQNLRAFVNEPHFHESASLLLARLQIRIHIQQRNWHDATQSFLEWTQQNAAAGRAMGSEMQTMFRELWNTLPTEIDQLDPAHLLRLLQSLHHDDRTLIGIPGLQALQTALQAEADRSQNRHKTTLEGYLKMAAQATQPNSWELNREAWWPRLESSLTQRKKSQQDIEDEHLIWAQIATTWNQPTPLLAMATAEKASDNTAPNTDLFVLPEATRIGYLQQAAAMKSDEARTLIDKIERQKRTLMTSTDVSYLSIPSGTSRPQADELGKKILEHLENHQSSKDLHQLLRARELALQIPADDFRRAGFLGLIERSRAEQTPQPAEQQQLYQQASIQFLEAFELGDARGLWYAAVCKYLAKDQPGYRALLEKGARQCDPECLFALAQETIHENETTAIGLVIQAAKLGHAKALANCKSNESAYRRRGFGSELDQLKLKMPQAP
ncbi:hypothetical protein FEM03_01870 [Phragmitibacter flavus]|uniref:Protein kinase domain-containing protein n=1 Tax=Phragmitibacter flavus TaxID=2576071 RepID=A0A5R8KKI6_9BACT|nr:serine/threonine-protein kinase [Phragmitibacter flavus]TLD72844.1 hypothetical protein FEM03_01870 [Phragmitibacter flavus]